MNPNELQIQKNVSIVLVCLQICSVAHKFLFFPHFSHYTDPF